MPNTDHSLISSAFHTAYLNNRFKIHNHAIITHLAPDNLQMNQTFTVPVPLSCSAMYVVGFVSPLT
jgi:hypothetical protein